MMMMMTMIIMIMMIMTIMMMRITMMMVLMMILMMMMVTTTTTMMMMMTATVTMTMIVVMMMIIIIIFFFMIMGHIYTYILKVHRPFRNSGAEQRQGFFPNMFKLVLGNFPHFVQSLLIWCHGLLWFKGWILWVNAVTHPPMRLPLANQWHSEIESLDLSVTPCILLFRS